MSGWRGLLIIVGGVLVFFGVSELRLSSKAETKPQRISCADLAAKGPGDNAHVVVTDFLLCQGDFIYAEENGRWVEAWVPAVPLNGAYHTRALELIEEHGENVHIPPPTDVRVIVKLPKARNNGDIAAAGDKDSLRGMIVNEIESLEPEARNMLQKSYPGVNWKNCWILELERRPAGAGKLFGFLGGGLALALVGLLALLTGNKEQEEALGHRL